MRRLIPSFFAVLCSISFSFAAEDNECFISLTKKAQTEEKLPTNVTTISSSKIEKLNARNLAEALEFSSDLNVGKYGTLGSMSSIILRGALDKQVLLLVDGRPVNDTTLGGFNYSSLNVDNIERVEIIRGAASSIYGANALAGVINVITKEACVDKPVFGINSSIGSYGEKTLGVNVSGKFKNIETNISVGKLMADGFRENSAYDNNNFDAYAGFDLQSAGRLKIRSGMANYELGSPGKNLRADYKPIPIEEWDNIKEKAAFEPLAKQKNNSAYFTLSSEKNIEEGTVLTSNFYTNLESGRFISPTYSSDDSTKKETLGLDMRVSMPGGLTAGVETRKDSAKRINEAAGLTSYDKTIDWVSFYIQEEYSPAVKLNTLLGLRHDRHSLFGGETSPQLTVVWEALPGWKISSNVGKAFRAPSIEDLFSPYDPSWLPYSDTQGNPDLKPETSLSYDLGFKKEWKKSITSKITLFKQDINNLIEWSDISTDSSIQHWRPSNVSQSYNQGVEFELNHSITETISYDVNYTYLESKGKRLSETEYKALMYRPAHTASMMLNYMMPYKTNLTLSGKYVGEQYDDSPERNLISTYSLYNLRLEKTFFNYTKVFAGVNNISDTRYFTRAGYPLPGRTFNCGVNVTF